MIYKLVDKSRRYTWAFLGTLFIAASSYGVAARRRLQEEGEEAPEEGGEEAPEEGGEAAEGGEEGGEEGEEVETHEEEGGGGGLLSETEEAEEELGVTPATVALCVMSIITVIVVLTVLFEMGKEALLEVGFQLFTIVQSVCPSIIN